MSRTLKGKITISRTQSSHGDQWISIRVEDEGSRVTIVDAKMSLEDFAGAVTGLGYQPIEFATGDLSLIGKKMENKTITLSLPESLKIGYPDFKEKFAEWFEEAIKPFEVDGWRARREGFNWHRKTANEFSVGMVRFVEE